MVVIQLQAQALRPVVLHQTLVPLQVPLLQAIPLIQNEGPSNWGLVGLLGLFGLIPLFRRSARPSVSWDKSHRTAANQFSGY